MRSDGGRTRHSGNDAELFKLIGSRAKILARGRGDDAEVIGTAAVFAFRLGGSWEVVGYHEVVQGGWRPADGVLWWRGDSGETHEVALNEPGHFPELFAERVAATILIDRVVSEGDIQARIVVRRDLSLPDGEPVWVATAISPVDPDPNEFEAVVAHGLEQIRADYGIG